MLKLNIPQAHDVVVAATDKYESYPHGIVFSSTKANSSV